MLNAVEPIDNVFHGLSDPTRRRVLERLSRSPASVSELAAPFAIALRSFVQHLKVLESCGLVALEEEGPGADLSAGDPEAGGVQAGPTAR